MIAGPARSRAAASAIRPWSTSTASTAPSPASERSKFEELEAVPPQRRLPLGGEGAEGGDVLLRAVDLLAPLARGQRVLVNADPRLGPHHAAARARPRAAASADDSRSSSC